jgi:RHH-type proline utilization regulon transcriptional repressor/proline dehydrogenase/delta 1-pyrroline-5-carboxylate dehydrogenase
LDVAHPVQSDLGAPDPERDQSGDLSAPRAGRAERAEALAAELLADSRKRARDDEQRRRAMLARLAEDPRGQVFTTALTDRIFRSKDPKNALDQLRTLSERFGTPSYLGGFERTLLSSARTLGPLMPGLSGSALLARVRGESRSVLLPAEAPLLSSYLARRHAEGVRINVNQLGEALLGEQEAETRVAKYETLAASEGVDALSVKVSSIGSQLNLLAFEHTTELLAGRLRRIYAASLRRREPALIMLDMESYQDVALTFAALSRALEDATLTRVRAGLVLQAYLPDSNELLRRALALGAQRTAANGQPLHLRLVKGANLAQERVESAKSGHALPIFASKREVDANFKRLLEHALPGLRAGAITLGVGSHNLFDVAYALVLRQEEKLGERLGIEMLEGMANDTVRALAARGVEVLVYAPICRDDAINSGIAYLVRRLDENTAGDNFLRASFAMRAGDATFERERARFRDAVALIDQIDETPRRARGEPEAHSPDHYRSERDSDLTRPDTRAALLAALAAPLASELALIRSAIAGEDVESGADSLPGEDPSRPDSVPYRLQLADAGDVQRALDCAARDPAGFSRLAPEAREALLERVAELMSSRRGELIRALVLDGGKRVVEADAEVSEAIDFARYYAFSARALLRRTASELSPRGVVLVTPPWNFPLAIAAGGVLSALCAGNRVILKPALETPLVGRLLAQLIWEAGVPKPALQLVICEDEVASALVKDARVDSVILTGATETARLFQRMRPGLRLLAETGGKNAYVVTAVSDRELAVRDVVQSAFGHAGQKCSACSLLILEDEVYDDAHFMETLADATRSLSVGSAWEPVSFVTPLIRPPSGPLLRALTTLDSGESWLVPPRFDTANPRLISPAIKLGVEPRSFMHTTELFGPVLAVMRASSLPAAVALANQSGYALSAGLAALDERAQAYFIEHVRAGNIYVNRTITGAIVARQPFGGYGKSGFGPGAKAGGPNYVGQLFRATPRERAPARAQSAANPVSQQLEAACELLTQSEAERLTRYVTDYAFARASHFALTHDFGHVLGQDNLFSYRPKEHVSLRVEADGTLFDALASCLAALLAGNLIDVSVAPEFTAASALKLLAPALKVESPAELGARSQQISVLRLLGTRRPELATVASEHGAHIADEPLLPDGGLELLHYLREQSLSVDYHRYGNLGARGLK